MSRFGRLSTEFHYQRVTSIIRNPGQTVLDVGCGTAETVRQYVVDGTARLVGIEKLEPLAFAAKQRLHVIVGDLDRGWSFQDCSIDVVSANQVIEHIIETDAFAGEAFRVLRPGGWAVISTENLAAWPNIIALLLGQEPFSTNFSRKYFGVGNRFSRRRLKPIGLSIPHYSVASLSAVRHLFELAGFTFRSAQGVHILPVPFWLLRKLTHFDTRHSLYITLLFQKSGSDGKSGDRRGPASSGVGK